MPLPHPKSHTDVDSRYSAQRRTMTPEPSAASPTESARADTGFPEPQRLQDEDVAARVLAVLVATPKRQVSLETLARNAGDAEHVIVRVIDHMVSRQQYEDSSATLYGGITYLVLGPTRGGPVWDHVTYTGTRGRGRMSWRYDPDRSGTEILIERAQERAKRHDEFARARRQDKLLCTFDYIGYHQDSQEAYFRRGDEVLYRAIPVAPQQTPRSP